MSPLVNCKWLYKHIDDQNLIILDASIKSVSNDSSGTFSGISIKGARFFDLKNKFSNKDHPISNMIPDSNQFTNECQALGINEYSIIIVFNNLGIYSSPRVWWMFRVMGFKNIAVLDGGLPEWIKNNLPSERIRTKSATVGNFIAAYEPELIRNQTQILENIQSGNEIVIDTRSNGRFTGKSAEPREGLQSGHIPDSINIPYKSVLNTNSLRPINDLRKLFASYNLKEKSLIFSCGSGVTACIVLLAVELVLCNNKSLYDGSWAEWASANSNPIHTSER